MNFFSIEKTNKNFLFIQYFSSFSTFLIIQYFSEFHIIEKHYVTTDSKKGSKFLPHIQYIPPHVTLKKFLLKILKMKKRIINKQKILNQILSNLLKLNKIVWDAILTNIRLKLPHRNQLPNPDKLMTILINWLHFPLLTTHFQLKMIH